MNILMCPICRQRLNQKQSSWQCDNGHSYDQAKQGYVNLHVVQHKHSKSPGDTPESVLARRAFLSGGFYQPLRDAVIEKIKHLSVDTLLDIGCGEGYYTSAMQSVVKQCIGFDIAKTAIQHAAKTNRNVNWVVATSATIPVLDESVDLCTSLFSPIPQAEILRVLKNSGYLIVVTPAAEHLYAMREALFDEVKQHEPEKFVTQLEADFELIDAQCIETELHLTQVDLKNLIAMTPYAYKAKAEKRQMLEQQSQFQLTAQFQIYIFKKR